MTLKKCRELRNTKAESLQIFLLIIACLFFASCSQKGFLEKSSVENFGEKQIIIVKVPPFYDDKLSRNGNYWRYRHFLFPQVEIPNPLPNLPYDQNLIFVSVAENGKIKFNGSEDMRSVSDTDYLKSYLAEIFLQREKDGMYEPGNRKVYKAVGIKTAHSVKYGDFMKVVSAIEESGADPIVLLFDDDAGL